MFEGLRFCLEGVGELFGFANNFVKPRRNRQVRCGRNRIVSGLRHVDMGVGMNHVLSFVTGEHFICQIADHFIDIHIDACVAAALPHVERKFLFVAAGDHLAAGCGNRLGDFRLHSADSGIRFGTGLFDLAQCFVHVRIGNDWKACCSRYFHVADGLNAVIAVVGNFHFAQAIAFDSHIGHFRKTPVGNKMSGLFRVGQSSMRASIKPKGTAAARLMHPGMKKG